MRILVHVVGARPNFMKLAPILQALHEQDEKKAFRSVVIHTGQHYDLDMSERIFRDLSLPQPDVHLNIGSGRHGEQTGRMLAAIEERLADLRPEMLVVVGDVNSTLAGALAAAKLQIPVAHVEAGLRSFDRSMPEEINRVLTDAVSDLLFTSSEEAEKHLLQEGRPKEGIHFVGNVMIDTLLRFKKAALQEEMPRKMGVKKGGYILVTLHRPSNVDKPAVFERILKALALLAKEWPVLFPVHPRTRRRLPEGTSASGLHLCDPMGYLEFLGLMQDAALVLTDSGGIQEETTILGVPCLTLRPNTERPVTLSHGTNRLFNPEPEAATPDAILGACRDAIAHPKRPAAPPPFWDGKAASRIAEILLRYGGKSP